MTNLTCRAQTDDERKLQVLESNRQRFVGYLRSKGVAPVDVEDLLQDLTVLVLRSNVPRHHRAAGRWLHTALENLLRQKYRRESKRHRRLGTVVSLDEPEAANEVVEDGLAAKQFGPEEVAVGRAVYGQVADGLRRLRPSDRELLVMLACGETAAEIAREVGLTRQAIWDRAQRARRHLAAELPPDLVAELDQHAAAS